MSRNSTERLLPTTSDHTTGQRPTDDDEYEPTAPLANMGVNQSTARIIAPLSFAIDFACQVYGMTAKPNMKQIHDANPCAFSPQPFAIAGFFTPQQVIQLAWLRELFRPDAQVESGTLRYVPWYALGNICIAVWMVLWVSFARVLANDRAMLRPELERSEGIQHPRHDQHSHAVVLPVRAQGPQPEDVAGEVDQHRQHHLCGSVSGPPILLTMPSCHYSQV